MFVIIALALHIFLGAMFGHPAATFTSTPDCSLEQCTSAELAQQAADGQDPASWGTDNYGSGSGVSLHAAITAHNHHKGYCVKRHYVHAYTTHKGVHVRGHWVKAYCVKAN